MTKCRKGQKFVEENLLVDNDICKDVEKNTRKQNECQEWHQQKKCWLTASLFSCVINRRKSIYPKSIVEKLQTPNKVCTASCKWGINNEQKALVRYHNHKEESTNMWICVQYVVWWLISSGYGLVQVLMHSSPTRQKKHFMKL